MSKLKNKKQEIRKEGIKLSLFTDDTIVCIENPIDYIFKNCIK